MINSAIEELKKSGSITTIRHEDLIKSSGAGSAAISSISSIPLNKGSAGSSKNKNALSHPQTGLAKRSVTNSELKLFLKGASAAQQAQVQMIYRVFDIMDSDSDGYLSVNDVKTYFRSLGRISDDVTVKKWIRARDINQTGTVSLPEFVASFAHQLDPDSRSTTIFQKAAGGISIVSSIATSFGALKLGNSSPEVLIAVDAIIEYIRRALDSPSTESFWRISKKDSAYNHNIGRLFGGTKLMHSMGFVDELNGTVLALRDEAGSQWATIPDEFRQKLLRNIEELNLHKQSLQELSVSHVAAVSSAISLHGDSALKISEWGVAMETLLAIYSNVLKHPRDPKYYRINTSNPNFHRRCSLVKHVSCII